MHGNLRKIDNARRQAAVARALRHPHATARRCASVLPQPGSPDMVFTANAGLVKGQRFIVSRFRYPERQYEEPYFRRLVHGPRLRRLARCRAMCPSRARATRSSIAARTRLWMAHGHRSISQRARGARQAHRHRGGDARLIDQRFYHLDTCFCPLEGGYRDVSPAGLDDDASRAAIEKRVPGRRAHRDRRGGRARLRLQRREHRHDRRREPRHAAFRACAGPRGLRASSRRRSRVHEGRAAPPKCLTLRLDRAVRIRLLLVRLCLVAPRAVAQPDVQVGRREGCHALLENRRLEGTKGAAKIEVKTIDDRDRPPTGQLAASARRNRARQRAEAQGVQDEQARTEGDPQRASRLPPRPSARPTR